MARLIGAHMPTSGGLHKAILSGHEIGCTTVQVFTSSPQQWSSKPIAADMVEKFAAAKKETEIDVVISHDSYLVNLAARDESARDKSISALVGELKRCSQLGICAAVSHMGSHLGDGEEAGLQRLAEGAAEVLAESPDDVVLAMETTAGQGTNLGYKFEHLEYVIEHNKGNKRLMCCMDTCHIFAAGYDIRTKETFEATMKEFDKVIGFEKLKCVHVNDSLKEFGSRKDRHAHIGEGEIGPGAFELLVNDKRFAKVPLILETPDAETMHAVNLKKLLSMVKK